MIDTSSLSGYAEAFADALNNGGSYTDAYAAAEAAYGDGNYSYFNDFGGVSTGYTGASGNASSGGPYASLFPGESTATTGNDKADSIANTMKDSLLPSMSYQDMLNHPAVVKDYNGNPVAIDFSKENWQPAWDWAFGPGNQIITDSTNLANVGKDIRNFTASNSNPMIWSQQAQHGLLTNLQGQSVPVSPKVQQMARTALQRVDADKGVTQAAVAAKALQNTRDFYKSLGQTMPEEYNRLAPGGYTLTPWLDSTPTVSGTVSSIDQQLLDAGLSYINLAQLTPAERFELYQGYVRGGVL